MGCWHEKIKPYIHALSFHGGPSQGPPSMLLCAHEFDIIAQHPPPMTLMMLVT